MTAAAELRRNPVSKHQIQPDSIRLQSVRMMRAIVMELAYELHMLNAQTAFLNADVEENVLVKMAPGCETNDKAGVNFVMKLKKCLYAL